jgi:putative dimethyl sulfoxide reductase chaperone
MSALDRSPLIQETAPLQRRSVFGNYTPVEKAATVGAGAGPAEAVLAPTSAGGGADLALTRSFVHQFLARAFDCPTLATWTWLSGGDIQEGLAVAVGALHPEASGPLQAAYRSLEAAGVLEAFERFHDAYVTAIGHAARGSCPVNEIEYGDLKADPLFQPHRLADLAAFYHAFGLEIGALSDERLDHLSVELEFMAVLTAQEANLLSTAPESDALAICRDAQRKFLREHLGRWTPAFARRVHRAVGDNPLGALALFALAFN